MEGLTPCTDILKALRYQAKELTSTGLSLTRLLDEEACRLKRGDEASRLKALSYSIRQELESAQSSENAVEYGHNQASLILSLGGLAVGSIIKAVSKDERLSTFSDHLITGLSSKKRPFGTVLVFIGPKGLPDDVGVVSISRLARESNREESQVINQLQKGGYLLLGEKAFSLLIDKLINDVQEGRLLLPIPTEKLAEIKTSTCLRLEARKPG